MMAWFNAKSKRRLSAALVAGVVLSATIAVGAAGVVAVVIAAAAGIAVAVAGAAGTMPLRPWSTARLITRHRRLFSAPRLA
jgi:hypothetical protein